MSTTRPPEPSASELRALFDELCELAPAARAARFAELELAEAARARLEALLRNATNTPALFATPALDVAAAWIDDDVLLEAWAGRQIGPFRVVGFLGQGGTAMVFRAERAAGSATQFVALKVMRTAVFTQDEQRRFLREQAILAQLSHPNIARLIEAGVSDTGTPFLAMELVEGMPITHYADAQQANLRQRLALMTALCRAVEAAHAALVVHRDLKPSNVFVDAHGEIKVLDFGIAKLLADDSPRTQTQAIMLTPGYAAPEQYQVGAITTAVDVHALGVLLGEILTGQLLGGEHSRRASVALGVTNDRPTPRGLPTREQLARQLRGDLDAIIATATAEEPARRYRSAGAFADDLERFLAGRAVHAVPTSRWYRARKFVGRHRGSVALTALLALGVLVSLAVALWQARVAREQARRANVVREMLIDVFDTARANLPRHLKPSPQDLVREGLQRVRADQTLDTDTRADLLEALGQVSASNADYDSAGGAIAQALSLRKDAPAERTRLARLVQAEVMSELGQREQAWVVLAPLLDELRAAPDERAVRAFADAASVQEQLGKLDASVALAEEGARIATQVYPADSTEALEAAVLPGAMLAGAGRATDAVAALEPVLAHWRAANVAKTRAYAEALSQLAAAKSMLGDMGAAEALTREALAVDREILTAPHDAIADDLNNLGALQTSKGDYAAAEATLQEALAMRRAMFGDNHVDIVRSLLALAGLRGRQQRPQESLAILEQAAKTCAELAAESVHCPRANAQLVVALSALQRFDEALHYSDIAVAQRRKLYGDHDGQVASALMGRAMVLLSLNRPADAEQACREAMSIYEALNQTDDAAAALAMQACARARLAQDDATGALDLAQRADARWTRAAGGRQPERLIDMRLTQMSALVRLQRGAEAVTLAQAELQRAATGTALDAARRAKIEAFAAGGNVD
jgi:serine/threonine-protein kinase